MAKSELKLLGAWPSPYVLRVQIALSLKGIEYEFIEEPLYPKSQLLLELNPVYKKIPVLIHHDKLICESFVIVQYIDEVWPSTGPSIIPLDPYDRAIARFWVAYIDDKLLAYVQGFFTGGEEEKKKCRKQFEESVLVLEDAFQRCSKGKQFFGGDEIGLVDIIFGSFLGWIKTLDIMAGTDELIDEIKTPKLKKWAEMFLAHAAVKHSMPETDMLIGFAKFLQAFIVDVASPRNQE